jgi:hypothetical protein
MVALKVLRPARRAGGADAYNVSETFKAPLTGLRRSTLGLTDLPGLAIVPANMNGLNHICGICREIIR